MANKDDYLTEYRQFFEEFANTVEPNDQLPVKLGSYKFLNSEVVGGIIDWCLQYLNRKSCPSTLVGPLIRITIDEIRKSCRNNPIACGFNPIENVYEPLKLMQTVMSKINEICLQYLDNSRLDTLPTPPSISPSKVSMCATRNTRRRMEDRHVVIHDMHSMFNIPDTSLASYYAIFDGHAGSDAAAYSAAHLHQFLAESEFYPTDPERALKEAFSKTDEFFLEKSKVESFRSGTTAVCALLRPKEEMLYVAWVGDSQALLVNNGKVLQIVKPHKPSREDEKDRIEANGGCVMFWGMWRVNGQLAVSRAIGDFKMKPYVTAEPDVVIVPLDGNEEFLIMACDGLWDFVSEDDAAICVYNCIKKNPENVENIAESLADLAKQEGSRDNISVIVIFLKDPSKIAKKLNTNWGWTSPGTTDAAMETGVDNQINNASNNFDLFDVFQKRGTIDHFNDESDFKSNGTDAKKSDLYLFDRHANGKRPASDFEDDLGPETNIDSLDDISPTVDKMTNKIDDKLSDLTQRMADIVDEVVEKSLDNLPGNNNFEKMEEDVDLETQGQNYCGIEPVRDTREETATPPADSVLDSSGLADNVAESEDSEDEWNYYRVDPEQKEATTLGESDNKIADSTDEMSQLNPDAKEFVPVSPIRATGSPAPFSRDLVDDTLLAQSPRRAIPMDINVPSPGEFQFEVKQRPSELFDEFEDKNPEEQNGHQLSSQEIMQNLLNGKNVNEIEFRPQKLTPDNIFGNNVDSDNQNVLETDKDKENASVSEEKTESSLSPIKDEQDFSNFVHKAQDPMNMSFYQDEDEETAFSSNPFDLNKVQLLPENVDEFIQQPESPLGVPLAKSPLLGPNRESPVPISNKLEVSKSPESKSLVEIANSPVRDVPKSDSPICSGAKTPEIPTSTNTGKSEYLSRLESAQQNEENERESLMQQKKICEEKSDACCELEVQNEFIQIDLCAEKQKQQNLANKITLTQQIMSDTIENFNKVRNLMQLCINCLEDTDVSKQKVVTILEKLNSRLNAEEQHHVKRLNDSKQCLTDCKEEHILRIEQIHRNIEQKFIEIRTKERDFFNLLNQTTNIKNKKEKYKEEINAREYEFSNLSSEYLELQTYLENLTKCKEVKEFQLITKSSDWEAESRKLAEMYLNLQTGLSESQNELSCKNELFKSLENKTESLESCLLDLNTALYNTEKEKTDLEGGFRMDLKNYDGKLEVLQNQIEESKSTNIILEQNNELLNQELCEMETNMTEMKTQLDNTDSDLTRYKKELNQTQTVYGEQCLKFESEIISLKQILDAEIQTEMKDINLKSNLKVSLDELNKQYENIIAQKEKACIEAEEEEVTANIDTDSIKDEIIKQKAAIDILLNEIAKCKILQNEKIETVKKQTEEEIKNKNLQFDNLRTELSERMSNEKKLFLDELNKLKNNKQTLELQTLEIKVSTQSLELEIRAKDEEFLHLLKQKSEAVNKSKIGGNQEPRTDKCVFKVPKFHIPPFKYSSSESSMDEKPLQKRRKILTRKPSGKMTGTGRFPHTLDPNRKSSLFKRDIKKPVF